MIIGRIICRPVAPNSPENHTCDMGLLSLRKDQTFFRRDRIYEINQILGELIISDIGPAGLANNPKLWNHDIGTIMSLYRKQLVLTDKEYKNAVDKKLL
jgi:hypothetical protein